MLKRIVASSVLGIVLSIPLMIVIDSLARFSPSDWAWFLSLLTTIIALLGSAVWAINVLIKSWDA